MVLVLGDKCYNVELQIGKVVGVTLEYLEHVVVVGEHREGGVLVDSAEDDLSAAGSDVSQFVATDAEGIEEPEVMTLYEQFLEFSGVSHWDNLSSTLM